MARLVMKFGGTSVANLERIANICTLIKREVDRGNHVAVIVSAMAGETNRLVDLVQSAGGPFFDSREYDTVVASGEQVTAGLTALTLQKMGVNARSWLGWQMPLKTNDSHTRARILDINVEGIETQFSENIVAVCAGFQGVDAARQRITTLGRGGSDTSAVALAAALKADRCDIYTDVDGIYTTDPRIVPYAQKIDKISHEEMLEMASSGSKVLETRSIEIAMNHGVKVQVLSSFDDKPGTLVVSEDETMEERNVTGIAHSKNEAKISLINLNDKPGVSASIFGPLSDANINVDMIVQSLSPDGRTTDMTFTVPRIDLKNTVDILEKNKQKIGFEKLSSSDDVVKISVVGVGMRSHAGVAQKMFETLAAENINIQVISTSEIKISTLINEKYMEVALRALHTAYGLDVNKPS